MQMFYIELWALTFFFETWTDDKNVICYRFLADYLYVEHGAIIRTLDSMVQACKVTKFS